jgi:RNA polymerase sigma factor (TIGR02999 family)
MAISSSDEVTRLLQDWSAGDQSALEKLMPLIEAEMRRLAQRHMRREAGDCLLQTTALINEAVLRLIKGRKLRWQNRAHFFGVSARLMRQILVDYARAEHSLKRGGGTIKVVLEEAVAVAHQRGEDVIALDAALTKLAVIDARKSLIVELRFFGGLRVPEVAEVLKVKPRTVEREWALARAWLYRELAAEGEHDT